MLSGNINKNSKQHTNVDHSYLNIALTGWVDE